MKTIKQSYLIQASIQDVWRALTESVVINKWGGGPAKMTDSEGAMFSLWGGDIHGKNLEVKTNKLLRQEWISGNWKTPSIVTFTLTEKDTNVRVELLHERVPNEEAKEISDGWNDYYLGSIKDYLEQ
jgi:uncharacterized protein YndB with AHSA1/START domain